MIDKSFIEFRFSVVSLKMLILIIKKGVLKNRDKSCLMIDYVFFYDVVS